MSVSNVLVPNNFSVYTNNTWFDGIYVNSPRFTTTTILTGAMMVPFSLINTSSGITFPSAADIWAAQSNPRAGDTFYVFIFTSGGGVITYGTGCTLDPVFAAFPDSVSFGSRRTFRVVLNSPSSVYINGVSN